MKNAPFHYHHDGYAKGPSPKKLCHPDLPLWSNIFAKFCNSALEVQLCKVALPQLCSRGNVLQSSASATLLWGYVFLKFHFRNGSRGNAFANLGNVFTKFCFRNFALGVISWQSSTSATPLRRKCLQKFRVCNHAVEGSVFMKFHFSNSALGVMSSQRSASAM